MTEPFEAGFLHYPDRPFGSMLALTHGAGGSAKGALLIALADTLAEAGMLVYRYNLPFRQRRPQGPPSPATAEKDRGGIREALGLLRQKGSGRLLAGGHSYGGRQTTMAAAEDPGLADGLLLLSYPLHAPGRPEQLRTGHFPALRIKSLFVHGSKDPFGSPEEMREAVQLIAAPHELLLVPNAGHDLGKHHSALAQTIAGRVVAFHG